MPACGMSQGAIGRGNIIDTIYSSENKHGLQPSFPTSEQFSMESTSTENQPVVASWLMRYDVSLTFKGQV